MPGSGPRVAVVGGGIAGLAAAWELLARRPDAEVVVLEADHRFGGKISSAVIGGRSVDIGPDAFVARRPEAAELCRELGLGQDLVAPGSARAYVHVGGALRRLPEGLVLGLPTRLGPLVRSRILTPRGLVPLVVDAAARWRRGATEAARTGDGAVGPLASERLGPQVVDRLLDPLVGAIHAGPVDNMSAAAVFPALLEAAVRPGSLARNLRRVARPSAPGHGAAPSPVFLTVRGGLTQLVGTLVEALEASGASLRPGSAVRSLRRHGNWTLSTDHGEVEADAVVLAVSASVAAGLLRPLHAPTAGFLAGVRSSSVALATLRFAAGDVGVPLDGTGCLVARHQDTLLTACTWMTSKWPHLAVPGDVLVRVSAGRAGDERVGALDDAAYVARATEELAPVLALRAGPEESVVTRFADAFPQYEVGHLHHVEAAEQAVAGLGGLALAGAILRGVGIPACIASGRRAARAVLGPLADGARP